MALRSLTLVLLLVAWGCGSVVVVDDPDANGPDAPIGSEAPSSSNAGSDHACIPCVGGDCGLCALEGGDVAFRCASAVAPPVDADCEQTTNLFEDDNGEFYACWRCTL